MLLYYSRHLSFIQYIKIFNCYQLNVSTKSAHSLSVCNYFVLTSISYSEHVPILSELNIELVTLSKEHYKHSKLIKSYDDCSQVYLDKRSYCVWITDKIGTIYLLNLSNMCIHEIIRFINILPQMTYRQLVINFF